PALAVARAASPLEGTVRLVGTGPYRVVDASPGRMALEAVPGHWGGAPRAERIVFLEVASDDHAEAERDARALDARLPRRGARAQVRSLLLQGNWPKGATAAMLASSEPSVVNVPKLAEAIGLMLGAADIPVRVQLQPADALRAAHQTGAHEIALAEAPVTGGDPHLFLFPLSTSEGARPGALARNFSFYRNPRLDDVLIRASQLSSRVERARLYQRAQALLADDMPWIPIYVRLVWAVTRPEVRNLRLHPTGLHRLNTVTLEPGS